MAINPLKFRLVRTTYSLVIAANYWLHQWNAPLISIRAPHLGSSGLTTERERHLLVKVAQEAYLGIEAATRTVRVGSTHTAHDVRHSSSVVQCCSSVQVASAS
jgi:hypothetical protein